MLYKNVFKPKCISIMSATMLILIAVGLILAKENKRVSNEVLYKNILFENQKELVKNDRNLIEKYGIFGEYYERAKQKAETLSNREKIAQLFIIGNSKNTNFQELKKYKFGGYLFFQDFFNGRTEQQVKNDIQKFQENLVIPLLIAVDEEGGKVVRVSSNKKLATEQFKSPSEIYSNGGFEAIAQDTVNKSNLLRNLGINLNFAPVLDIASNPNDYMYSRALQQDKNETSIYAKTVISASKGLGVSYTLKHFPGYGNNLDTHIGGAIDTRTYNDIYNNDLEPFCAGIKMGAECVMISHNIVTSIDDENQASISPKVHELLRDELNFTGIIITDDLNMGAIREENSFEDSIVKAIISGNDMIIFTVDNNTKDKNGVNVTYSRIIDVVANAIDNGQIQQDRIDNAVIRILAWKYYKKMLD